VSRPKRNRARGEVPLQLLHYDWRDWREPALPNDPFPEYRTWYLGLFAWQEAKDAWLRGHLIQPQDRMTV